MPENKRLRTSVAMINYNYGRYLEQAIESVLAQEPSVDEIVVVDDGSTDGSRDILARYGAPVRAVLQDNAGAATASTRAVRESTGDVVLMLDSDDLMMPGRVGAVLEAYERWPEAQWVWHQQGHVDRPTMRELSTAPRLKNYVGGWHDHRAEVARGRLPITAPATSALSFRRDLLMKLMPIPGRMHVHDNYLKHAALGLAPGVVLEEFLSLQGIHDANVTTGVDPSRARSIRVNAGVDLADALRPLGLPALSDRFLAEALVGSAAGRRLTPERRAAAFQRMRRATGVERLRLAKAVAVATARAGYNEVKRRRNAP